jgi:hypothetical protein
MRYLAASLWLTATFALLGYATVQVDRWERTNNFPFGKLCELYHTCR